MSEVYARNREETKMAFYANALELQIEIIKFCMKEKFIPKKWRYAIGYDLISKVNELVDNITYANSIYPTSDAELELRKKFQTLAICNCFQIQNKIVCAERSIETVKIEKLEKVIELLSHEITLLKSWKKASKIIK